jgi:hypothetical protein
MIFNRSECVYLTTDNLVELNRTIRAVRLTIKKLFDYLLLGRNALLADIFYRINKACWPGLFYTRAI